MSHSAQPRVSWLRPWRSATAGWVVTGLALLGGVPLFLCLPPWNDVTLHDMVVRSMLRGGVLYRDVFDTNLPGIDWSMAAVRLAFGWSYEVLRAVDLVVIAAEVWLLIGWVRQAGAACYTVAWLAAAAALFYPFTTEFNHIQRDPWLLLPALVAARLRLRRVEASSRCPAMAVRDGATNGHRKVAVCTLLEGLAWGVAVWVKPHVIVPAVAVWFVSAVLITRRESLRNVLRDLVALVIGGLAAGIAGVAWFVGTGAWPYFLDVFLNWNPGYLDGLLGESGFRFTRSFVLFSPYSELHFAAMPLAVLALWEARVWSRRCGEPRRVWGSPWLYAPAQTEQLASARALLAALYLGWFVQGVMFQKAFDYVQVPMVLLAMAVVATHRWAFGAAFLVWFAFHGVLGNDSVLQRTRHPLTDCRIMELWPRCWREGGSAQLRDRLGCFTDTHSGTTWEDLESVAGFLRTVDPPLGPGELNCWHDSTHPLYLMLDLDPATRYMHFGTAFGIRKQAARIAAEVAASRQRYVVSDLLRLPPGQPQSQPGVFPWNQPVVFRSGRYLVHKVVNPLGEIDIPPWPTP